MRSPYWRFTVVLPLLAAIPLANGAEPLEDRVARIERQLESRVVIELMDQLQSMQRELQELRALSEEQHHQLEGVEKRQRDLYLDLDRRLARAEREGVDSSSSSTVEPQSTATTGGSLVVGELMPVEGAVPSSPAVAVVPIAATGEGAQPATAQSMSQAQLIEERQAYQRAFNLLRELRYDQASTEFRTFIDTYPQGRYAHIAQYWLGEASYAQRDFKLAITDYQRLIDNYSMSPKIAEAMLKIGYSRFELKQYAEAEQGLQLLLKNHPNTTESSQAQLLLQQIKKASN